MLRKKSLTAIVGLALILVVIVTGVVMVNQWSGTYLSGRYSSFEENTEPLDYALKIDEIIENKIYVINQGSYIMELTSYKINNITCNNPQNLMIGLNIINVENCGINISYNPEVVLITKNGILNQYVINNHFVPTSLVGSFTNGYLSGYAYGENVGFIHFNGSGYRVNVTDSQLFGYAYGENVGFISFNGSNYGVNITDNKLIGYAYGENVGFISFNGSNYGVNITDNILIGSAYGENTGFIHFNESGYYSVEYD